MAGLKEMLQSGKPEEKYGNFLFYNRRTFSKV